MERVIGVSGIHHNVAVVAEVDAGGAQVQPVDAAHRETRRSFDHPRQIGRDQILQIFHRRQPACGHFKPNTPGEGRKTGKNGMQPRESP